MSLVNDYDALKLGLKSPVIATRRNAFIKLNNYLTLRLDEFCKFFRDNEDDDHFSFDDLFFSVHEGIRMQVQKLDNSREVLVMNDNKIKVYTTTMTDFFSIAIFRDIPPILRAIFDAISDESYRNNFCQLYIDCLGDLLQKYPKSCFANVEPKLWKDLLKSMFDLLKFNRNQFNFDHLFKCIENILEISCELTYVGFEFIKIGVFDTLQDLLMQCNGEDKIKEAQNKRKLLVLAYHCCQYVAADHRFELCRFTENIHEHITYAFEKDTKEDHKKVIYKLMDLALVIHLPNLGNNQQDLEYICDKKQWFDTIKCIEKILNKELKQKESRNVPEINLDLITALFVARFCYYAYWNNDIWNDEINSRNENGESSKRPKRMKYANKLSSVIEKVKTENSAIIFNWNWLIVLAELLYNFPEALEYENYVEIITLLSECQPHIQLKEQIYAFTKCCSVLLKFDSKYKLHGNTIVYNEGQKFWSLISNQAIRVCTTSSNNAVESHGLLQLLIYYQKNSTSSFIESIIQIFVTNSTVKCDYTLNTLITILQSFNFDSLPNGTDLMKSILNYILEKPTVDILTKIRKKAIGERPTHKTVSKIAVMCCLLKTDMIKYLKSCQINETEILGKILDIEEQNHYKDEIEEIIHLIQLKFNKKLLIESDKYVKNSLESKALNLKSQQMPTELKCIIDQNLFETLMKLTEYQMKTIDEKSTVMEVKNYLINTLQSNGLMIHLASEFIRFEALNQEKFEASFIAKKIIFYLQEIERLFQLLKGKNESLDLDDKHKILTSIHEIFDDYYHLEVGQKIRSIQLTNCLNWIYEQIDYDFVDYSIEDRQVMKIGKETFSKAQINEKMRYLAVTTLCKYFNYNGVDKEEITKYIYSNVGFDPLSNMDLHAVFQVLEIFGEQENVSLNLVEWIWNVGVIKICSHHSNETYIMECLIEKLHNLWKISKNYPKLTHFMISIYHTFSKLCRVDSKRILNSRIAVKYIRQFKDFHETHFKLYQDENKVRDMYHNIFDHFLRSKSHNVRMATIDCLRVIFKENLEIERTPRDEKIINNCQVLLYDEFYKKLPKDFEERDINQNDKDFNKISLLIQLHSSMFCTTFNFRKNHLFELSKIFMRFKLSPNLGTDLFKKIYSYFNCSVTDSVINQNHIVDLLSRWIERVWDLAKITWYFFDCTSMDNFVSNYYVSFILSIMKTKYQLLDPFIAETIHDYKEALLPILNFCYAYFIPNNAECDIKYESQATKMQQRLVDTFTEPVLNQYFLENVSDIIILILENVIDNQKFLEICGFDPNFTQSIESISRADFDKCLNYMGIVHKLPSGNNLITYLCMENLSCVERLFMLKKKKVQSMELKENKLMHIFQYFILLEKTIEYMNDEYVSVDRSIKEYLCREVINYFGYLIADDENGQRLRNISASFLFNYLQAILPACNQQVKMQLHRIIPQLVMICSMTDGELKPFQLKCFDIIKYLILDQVDMDDEIAKLDRFPSSIEFEELRRRQHDIKYKDNEMDLIKEIEYFLDNAKTNRKIEGLIELREHLSNKKGELRKLFESVGNSDQEKSLLHRLLRSLVSYINSNVDKDRAIEAVKCLGEIGAHDIASVVFDVEDQRDKIIYQKVQSVLDCQRMICSKLLEKIEIILLHQNVSIFQAASESCYYLLKSSSASTYEPSYYLRPFVPEMLSDEHLFYVKPKENKKLNLHSILVENEYASENNVLKAMCNAMMLFAGNINSISIIIASQKTLADLFFVMIFQLLLQYNDDAVNNEILKTLNHFFEQLDERLNYCDHTHEGSIYINKKFIRHMLRLVEILRIHCQDHPEALIVKAHNLNYLHAAKAAKHCEAFFSAVQYCEIFAQTALEKEQVEFSKTIKNSTLKDILYHSYSAIGINEASSLYLNPTENRLIYLQNNELYYESLLETSHKNDTDERIELFNNAGLYRLAYEYNSSLKDVRHTSQHYECLWRLSKWDEIVDTESEIRDEKGLVDYKAEYEKYHYLSLKCSMNDDELGMKNSLLNCRKAIVEQINQQSLECSKTFYKFLDMSMRLIQLYDFSVVRFKRNQNSHEKLLEKWNIHNNLPFIYKHFEKVFAQRNSIFDTANIRTGKRSWIPDAFQSNLLMMVKQSIKSGYTNDSIKAIAKMKSLKNDSNKIEVLLEEAKLYYKTNIVLAKSCLEQILQDKMTKCDFILKSHAFRLYGEILAENYSCDISEIAKKYFEKAMKYLQVYANHHNKGHLIANLDNNLEGGSSSQNTQLSQTICEEIRNTDVDHLIIDGSVIYDTIAKYYDREYELKVTYMKSHDFVKKKENYKRNEERLKSLERLRNNISKDLLRTKTILKKSNAFDKQEIENAETEKKTAAKNAIYYYVRSAINSSDENIFGIFRIVALMLANFNGSSFIKTFLENHLLNIPSYKFIVALPQITVRLNDNIYDPLNCLLKKLLQAVALDHPHHALPYICALVNSYKDSDKHEEDEPRVVGAKDLWKRLKDHEKLAPIIKQMEKMSSALIHLANVDLKRPIIPDDHKVLKLSNLKYVQCPTIDLPIVKNGNYDKVITTVIKWESNIVLVGGINVPKKLNVLCSDGITRSQLLKGKDDMRQDAIMQQIFGVVNKFLSLDEEMNKKHARIRTYKVVPFSRRSGILEWCVNTLPIGSYLCGEKGKAKRKGAHEKYRPQDWDTGKCLSKVSDASGCDNDQKLEIFTEICENIKPVFHHFFDENYKNPGMHFERRYAYTMSVAVSSMIGYILGIGDRHVQNILIDMKTAELIHIDFGIAFELGKCLPHPEMIPFRLTRDIVAPMGISGVDGIFRKACEKTLEILRENERTITTILEVLLYDPMYCWSLGAEQARRIQLDSNDDDDDDDGEKEGHDSMANRTLQRVRAKLKGMVENSTASYPSIEGHVQYLIQSATNMALLSRLFRGWQAYL